MWEEDKTTITKKYTELLNSSNIMLLGIIRNHLKATKMIFPIITFILERIDTVIELAERYKMWDAEIVLRSAIETFTKFMYIATASKEEKEQRINEFWNSLAEIDSLKMSEQAKKNLKIFGNSKIHRIAYLPLILPDEIEAELREKWPRKKRQEVEKRWSFTEIINEIALKNQGTPLENITALSHGYRMSSHVTHGDETGIQIINERDSRSEEDRNKAYRGHFLRLFSDCFAFTIQIGILTMTYLDLQDEKIHFVNIMEQINDIKDLEAKYKDKIFEESYYDKYRSV